MYIELLIVDIDLATSSYKTIFFFFWKMQLCEFFTRWKNEIRARDSKFLTQTDKHKNIENI